MPRLEEMDVAALHNLVFLETSGISKAKRPQQVLLAYEGFPPLGEQGQHIQACM